MLNNETLQLFKLFIINARSFNVTRNFLSLNCVCVSHGYLLIHVEFNCPLDSQPHLFKNLISYRGNVGRKAVQNSVSICIFDA